jgi:hypothetical protein
MCFQRGAVGGKRRAVGSMNDAATIEDDGVVGDAKNFLEPSARSGWGDALVADDAAQRALARVDAAANCRNCANIR